MADLIKKIKIKKQDGTYTDYIPIGAEAKNVDCLDGESVEYKLNKKLNYFIINSDNTQEEIQKLFNIKGEKIIEFTSGNYTFNSTFILNANTKILLNNSILTFNLAHGFRNYKSTDEFLLYNGNSNIEILDGTIIGGACSFCHAKNINFININFKNCLGNHILEMMAINNLKVEGCTFAGLIDSAGYREYIQIDDCQRDNFPWFDNENNPTYDGTPNKNWNIFNNDFLASNNERFSFYTGIGGHTYIDGSYHSNINIYNNKFIGYTFTAIRLRNVINSNINYNYFNSGDSENIIDTIQGQRTLNNIIISYNKINGNDARFINFTCFVENVDISNNEIFNMKTSGSVSDDNNIIDMYIPINCRIYNNYIHDFNKRILYVRNVDDHTGQIEFFNNDIQTSENGITGYPLRFYGNGIFYCENNTIKYSGLDGYLIRLSNKCSRFIFKGNNIYSTLIDKMLSENGFTGYYTNIDNVMFKALTVDSNNITNSSLSYRYTDFNTMLVIIGTGNYTYTYTLKDFNPMHKLTSRTYRFNVSNTETDGKAILTLNSDNTITYNCNIGVNLRNIYLLNQ